MTQKAGMSVRWDPRDYAGHASAQHAWAEELIAQLALREDERILDVGCGDGKITAGLATSVPRGHVTGIDSSPEMIEFARREHPVSTHPNLEFLCMDARHIELPAPYDLVFSNAALHWVDDHRAFLRGASRALRMGGRLRAGCGGRGNAHDVFLAMRAEMRRTCWRGFFRDLVRPYHFYSAEDYARWLPEAGFHPVRIGLVERDMIHAGPEQLAAWVRTTWLPYTQRVPEDRREAFIAACIARYLSKHPVDTQGRTHVRMIRLEIDALKQ